MGIIENLLCMSKQQQVVSVTSIVPDKAKDMILRGVLPVTSVKTIMLNKDETCHYIDKAIMSVKEKKRYYQNRRAINTIKIFKGWNINLGGGRTSPTEYEEMKYYDGILYITNKRIIFSSQDIAFEKKISDLTAIVPYSDALGLQFGNDMTNFLMGNVELCASVINLINKEQQ